MEKNISVENRALLGYYVASSGKFLADESWTPRMGPIGCPEKSARNYHYSLRNNLEDISSKLRLVGSLK